jgi:Beta/Gamma crystallin
MRATRNLLLSAAGLLALGFPAGAQNLELQVVDKDCWVEIYEDEKYDADDPHIRLEGQQSLTTLKNLAGRDWNNDIESVIIGPNATVKAYSKKDFQGTEIGFTPDQKVPDLSKLKMSNEIESMKVICGKP